MNCGAEITAGAKFCSSCGKEVEAPQISQVEDQVAAGNEVNKVDSLDEQQSLNNSPKK